MKGLKGQTRKQKNRHRYYLHEKLKELFASEDIDTRARTVNIYDVEDERLDNKYVRELKELGYNFQLTIN